MTQTKTYAGFWKRFLAAVIDGVLLGIVYFVLFLPFMTMILGLGAFTSEVDSVSDEFSPAVGLAMAGTWFVGFLATTVVSWLYFALMESSSKGATLGKMALSIRVTDTQGNRVSFGRATGRYFGKIISAAILYIGFIMAAFTQQKQALHDIMAGCLVVNR